MRLLFIGTTIDRPETALISGLAAHGVEVEALLRPGVARLDQLRQAGVHVHSLEFRSRIDREAITTIRRRMAAGGAHIVHTLLNKPLSNTMLATRGSSVKVVAYRGIPDNLSRLNPGSWMTYLHPRISHIVCVCEAVRQSFLKLGLPPDRPVTIYKGHDLDWYQPKPRRALSEFGIPAEALVVASAAAMRPRKGMAVLLKAAERVTADRPVHYLLMGKLSDSAVALDRLSADLRQRVHFVGFREDAPQLTGAADVFVLPSLKREGLPKGVIEAMAQGVVPVVTNSGGSPELVRDGVEGRVVAPGDAEALASALNEMLQDADKRQRYGAAARHRIATDFHFQRTIEQHLALYARIVGSA